MNICGAFECIFRLRTRVRIKQNWVDLCLWNFFIPSGTRYISRYISSKNVNFSPPRFTIFLRTNLTRLRGWQSAIFSCSRTSPHIEGGDPLYCTRWLISRLTAPLWAPKFWFQFPAYTEIWAIAKRLPGAPAAGMGVCLVSDHFRGAPRMVRYQILFYSTSSIGL